MSSACQMDSILFEVSYRCRFSCIISTIVEMSNNVSPFMETNDVLHALAALAQESRLSAFRLLVQTGPGGLAASKIAEHLDIAPSSLSFHLKELAHAGLVVARQAGRFVIYSANFDTMNGVLTFLTENCCSGATCMPVAVNACAPQPALA